MVNLILLVFLCLVSFFVNAQDSSKAVTETSRELGLKLSPAARKNIGIQTEKIGFNGNYLIPKSSLVYTKDKIGIYCLRDDWFKFVVVNLVSKDERAITVNSKNLTPQEIIVIEGAALLRVSEMEAFSNEE